MRHSRHPRRRRGFTLVELLVACALTVLIMAVLATAFSTGMTTFSHLKSTVGLSEQLRSAETILRRDLEAVHLEDADGLPVRVSDPRLTTIVPPATVPSLRATKGYFEVLQATEPATGPTAQFIDEGSEDSVRSYRATGHALFFTSKLLGNSPQEVFAGEGPVPGDPELAGYAPGAFVGQWAEIGLFLAPTSVMTTDDGVTPGSQLKLYSLYRRQRVLATSPRRLPLGPLYTTATAWRDAYPDVSIGTQILNDPSPATTTFVQLNDPTSVTRRSSRLGYVATNTPPMPPSPTETAIMPDALPAPTFPFTSIRAGSPNTLLGTDVLVNNVVSMHIRVMDGRGKFYDRFTRIPNPSPLPLYLVESGLAPPTTYVNGGATEGFRLDTANPFIPTYPFGVQMRAVQIKLRVYDTKNHLTRQMTMTFDL